MGDSETVIAGASSAVMDYTSSSADYAAAAAGANSNVGVPEDYSGVYSSSEAVVTASEIVFGSSVGNVKDEVVGVAERFGTAETVSQPTGYVASDLDGQPAIAVENGVTSDQPSVDGSASLSAEEERLWNILKANSMDFDSWTALIEETEKVAGDKITKIRKVYDAFLAEFPLCYGYWKKYADHEARLSSVDKVVEIYERAVLGVTYSVDIWLHYCIFAMNTYQDADTIRRLFERGLAYVGTDYLSFPLWDKYIEYEEMHSEWARVAMIYSRILEIPNRRLDDYLNRFRSFVASRQLPEIRTAEEAAAMVPDTSDHVGQAKQGDVQLDSVEPSSKPVTSSPTEAEELEKYIAAREEMYKKAREFDAKICDFENSIRRPYFHVRPLNVVELENWHNYLDFIEGEGDFNKVVKLYERCLIACANYPEYWMRYVLCMEAFTSMDLANNALTRATQVFVKRRPEIHLFAARFREQNGDIPAAQASYQRVHTEIAPGYLEALVKHANMEYRLGNHEEALSLYDQAIAIEKGKENSHVLPMLYAQYSRFLYLVSGNAEKAREILDAALENVPLSKPLLEALLHLETFLSLPKRIGYLDSLVDKFIVPNVDGLNAASVADRAELSSIFLEFLSMFGDSQSIKKAEDRHVKLFASHRSKLEMKKRHAEDYLALDRMKMAKPYSDAPSAAQPQLGTYPSVQNQWAAGYAVQSQSWPPATQGQMQQYPGYTPQAAYGAYGSYPSSYVAPQAPTSVAQNAAYSSYPPTYTAQAVVPQQSYVQPTSAAMVAPAQQQASASQAYYGSYY